MRRQPAAAIAAATSASMASARIWAIHCQSRPSPVQAAAELQHVAPLEQENVVDEEDLLRPVTRRKVVASPRTGGRRSGSSRPAAAACPRSCSRTCSGTGSPARPTSSGACRAEDCRRRDRRCPDRRRAIAAAGRCGTAGPRTRGRPGPARRPRRCRAAGGRPARPSARSRRRRQPRRPRRPEGPRETGWRGCPRPRWCRSGRSAAAAPDLLPRQPGSRA